MKMISVRVDDELHAMVAAKAKETQATLADYVRATLHASCTQQQAARDETLDVLKEQLHVKDTQLECTQQIAAMAQANVQQLTQQLSRVQLALEDASRRSVWKRLKSVFVPESV